MRENVGAAHQRIDTGDGSQKRRIVILMNCAGNEVARYLRSSRAIMDVYQIEQFSNFSDPSDWDYRRRVLTSVAQGDVVITQNVQNISWMRNDEIAKIIKSECIFIRLAFWRFDGFWPCEQLRASEGFWYLPTEIAGADSYSRYISHPLPPPLVLTKFESELEKLYDIDSSSDLGMMDVFLRYYKSTNLFSDSWHPTSIFFFHLTTRILAALDVVADLHLLPNTEINRDRYRLVFDAVYDELGLHFDHSILRYGEDWITRDVFYEFSMAKAVELRKVHSTAEALKLFSQWRNEIGLAPHLINVGPLGLATQSSQDVWSHPDDAQRALRGAPDSGFAFHTSLDERPWWSVDLRDFREIEAIIISNRADYEGRALPLTISISHDGRNWVELANINYEFGGRARGKPLELSLATPRLARYLKVAVQRSSYLHLEQVEIYSKVIGTL